ncbi:hypothetical protein [Laspinema olomoucense]|nr:hypothetical protein [Laspinema sp. D3c]MCT7992460.1 hypothetical protein [Laspinema sp. D3c]
MAIASLTGNEPAESDSGDRISGIQQAESVLGDHLPGKPNTPVLHQLPFS